MNNHIDDFEKYCKSNEEFVAFYHGPFSQWYPSQFNLNGEIYNCTEQFMMASKARVFGDKESLNKIMNCFGPDNGTVHSFTKYPKEQKRLGRNVKNFNPEIWDNLSLDLVTLGNIAKFQSSPYLMNILGLTKGKMLIEASPYDKVWGVGMSVDNPLVLDPMCWKGQNLLGAAITQTRLILLGE